MKKKKSYWDNFYTKKILTKKESPFAKFSLLKLKLFNYTIYDLGCGNGRDTNFFSKNNFSCVGIDKSKEAISNNKKKNIFLHQKFISGNFCKYFESKNIKENFIIYSRFTWHSINYVDENLLIKTLKKQKNLKFIFIEARSINDGIYGKGKNVGKHEFTDKYATTHYRRFIDAKDIKKKISSFAKIIYFKESKNLAKHKGENPCVLRLIAKVK